MSFSSDLPESEPSPAQMAQNVRWNLANLIGEAIGAGELDGSNAVAVADAIRAAGSPEEFAAALAKHSVKEHADEASETANPVSDELEEADEITLLLFDIDYAVKDYRTIFPKPHLLAPNLDLAVRASVMLRELLVEKVEQAEDSRAKMDKVSDAIRDYLAHYTLPANYSLPYGPGDSHLKVAERGAKGITAYLAEQGLLPS